MSEIVCEGCGAVTAGYDTVNYGSIDVGYRVLCSRCFNNEVATRVGLDKFEHVRLEPVKLSDCKGVMHEFHLRTHLLGDIVSLEAFELRDDAPGGYEFQIVGDPREDLFSLCGRLVEKMRRALAVMHVRRGRLGLEIIEETVRGRIGWDDAAEGRLPLVTIDGQEFSWDELGHALMCFEGWQFKLEVADRSDEV
ncbi:MAG: hypothetical protein QFF03_05210 [Pseudomonadota bacterium]|nr:hypothetical protein [Pseudomonadota bacterium]